MVSIMKKFIFFLLLIIFLVGCSKERTGMITIDSNVREGEILTFKSNNDQVCYSDGKPAIRLFSTTWCPHCKWIKGTFNKVAKEYAEAGKISAYHWVLDTGDDELTEGIKESIIPPEEMGIFKRYNPDGSIPTFVFGCRYIRIGNGYEAQNNLKAEEAEFRAVIDKILLEEK